MVEKLLDDMFRRLDCGFVVMQGVKAFTSHTDWITSIAWSPHSEHQVLTSSHDKSAKLWDTRAAVPLHTLEGHTDKVCCQTCSCAV